MQSCRLRLPYMDPWPDSAAAVGSGGAHAASPSHSLFLFLFKGLARSVQFVGVVKRNKMPLTAVAAVSVAASPNMVVEAERGCVSWEQHKVVSVKTSDLTLFRLFRFVVPSSHE